MAKRTDDDKRTSHKHGGDSPPGEYRRRAKEHTIAGTALGAVSVGAFATLGTIACPLCVVAAPALIGSGIWNRRKAKKCATAPPEDNGPQVGQRIEWAAGG